VNPLNLCRGCGNDFTSLRLFDAHCVGAHDYEWSPGHPDGRRGLSTDEMKAKGWTVDVRGRWTDPARAADIRERLAG
jgi:hypothetical protein